MTLSSTSIFLIAVLTTGYLAAITIGRWVYYANEEK